MKAFLKWLCAGLCVFLAACAIITVNVYFPEKDVKEAYKSLDEMLLQPAADSAQPGEEKPAGAEEIKKEFKPQSRLFKGGFTLALVSVAHAEEPVADELAIELSGMPDVLKAYDEMRARLPQVNALRDSGAVGVNRQGLLTVRDKSKMAGLDALVKAENDNRKTVITSMARAIERINQKKQPGAKFDFNQLMNKAAAIYADLKREESKAGWWLELQDGTWKQK